MNKSLFNITQEFESLRIQLIESGGELAPEMESALSINKEELTTKAQGYISIIKHLEMEEDAINKELKRLTELKKLRASAKDRLKESLKKAMLLFDVTEIKTETNKVNFRKSESIEIEDPRIIPGQFLDVAEPKPSKSRIKQAIKEGRPVLGACIVENKNIQIK